MLRRTNFGMLVDDLGTSSEDEKALAELIKIAESVRMEIIENETAISIKFCLEVMKRLVKSGENERMHLLNHIDNLEERLKKRDWIPVSERLPEDGEYILITSIYGIVDMTHFSRPKNFLGFATQEIIAWQPLPEPYKESEGKVEKEDSK